MNRWNERKQLRSVIFQNMSYVYKNNFKYRKKTILYFLRKFEAGEEAVKTIIKSLKTLDMFKFFIPWQQ